MQVSYEFECRIKKLQKEIMKKEGKHVSMREITKKVVALPNFDDLEKQILNVGEIELKINLDRRKR